MANVVQTVSDWGSEQSQEGYKFSLSFPLQPEHMCEAVVRCPVHAASPLDLDASQQNSAGQSTRPTNHLIRADHPHAEYVDSDPQYGRQSVSVPFEAPAVGTQWSTVLYRYMCNSSCAGNLIRSWLV